MNDKLMAEVQRLAISLSKCLKEAENLRDQMEAARYEVEQLSKANDLLAGQNAALVESVSYWRNRLNEIGIKDTASGGQK